MSRDAPRSSPPAGEPETGAPVADRAVAGAGTDAPDPRVERFNTAMEMPSVNVVRMFLRACFPAVSIQRFVGGICEAPDFPEFSIRSLLAILPSIGADVQAASFNFEDLGEIPIPFLCRMKTSAGTGEFVLVRSIAGGRAQIVGPNGARSLTRSEMAAKWTGIVLFADVEPDPTCANAELEAYRKRVIILPNVLTREQCAEIVALAEEQGFRRSRIKAGREEEGTVSLRLRSSSSTLLRQRHPVLQRLYETCAAREGADLADLEWVQCVRYKPGQKFNPHFDGGNGMPRRATWLVYLNDGFAGGGTGFPELDLVVKPETGAALRFDNCDARGRVLWPSKHSGMPLGSGIKYALNLWVRLPGLRGAAQPSALLGPAEA